MTTSVKISLIVVFAVLIAVSVNLQNNIKKVLAQPGSEPHVDSAIQPVQHLLVQYGDLPPLSILPVSHLHDLPTVSHLHGP